MTHSFDAEADQMVRNAMRRIITDTDTGAEPVGRLRLSSPTRKDQNLDLQIMRDYIEKKPSRSPTDMLVLMADQRVEEEDGGFSRLRLGENDVANSAVEPPVSRRHVVEIAKQIVKEQIDERPQEAPQPALPDLQSEAFANVFAVEAGPLVQDAVAKHAPDQIVRLVEEITPQMIAPMVDEAVQDALATRVPEMLTQEIDARMAQTLQTQLQGALGRKVTEKIRLLIHAEVMSMVQSNMFET